MPEAADPSLAERVRRVRLLLLDVDGVLTDGAIVYPGDGQELKSFSVRDGFGLRCWREAGLQSAVITGRSSAAVARRCQELGVDAVIQSARDKGPAYRELLAQLAMAPEDVCAVGDDLPDLPLLLASGVGATVADGVAELRSSADYVTTARGGRGAVREIIEWLLAAQGRWAPILESYRRSA